jgi:hypothetical protein
MCVSRSDRVRVRSRVWEAAPAVEHNAGFARQAYIVVEAHWSHSQLKHCASLGLLETCNVSYLTEYIVPKVRELSKAGARPAQYGVLVTMMRRPNPPCECEEDCDCAVGKQVVPTFFLE